MADYEMTLHNPLTDEEWELITDASLDNTNEITFITKQGKEVKYVKASADVVKVVRCKDCKHYDGRPCGIVGWYNTADDFCSKGERRTDGTDRNRKAIKENKK